MIMNNVLSRVEMADVVPRDPYLIWYPSIAAESTYRELFRLRPCMAPQILRACIAGGYKTLFDEVLAKVEPDTVVVKDAEAAGGSFRDSVKRRISELGGKVIPIIGYEDGRNTRDEI